MGRGPVARGAPHGARAKRNAAKNVATVPATRWQRTRRCWATLRIPPNLE